MDGTGENKEKRRINQIINRYYQKIIDIVKATLLPHPSKQADDTQPHSAVTDELNIIDQEVQSTNLQSGLETSEEQNSIQVPVIGAEVDMDIENEGQDADIEANKRTLNIGEIREDDLFRLQAGGPVTRRMSAVLAAAASAIDSDSPPLGRTESYLENNKPLFQYFYSEEDVLAEQV